MRILLVGYGKMGQLVEELAVAQGMEIASRIDVGKGDWSAPADVAVDFSTAAALKENFSRYVERKLPTVIGTTGWAELMPGFRQQADKAGLGVVASANFSIGVNLFEMMVSNAARVMRQHQQNGAWIHEAHHATSETPRRERRSCLRDVMQAAGYDRPIDMSSTRAGAIPGIHAVGFDGASDTIELTHTARDRRGFASGALLAAQWIQDKRGWFSMMDVLR
jgi:4-hydroxy-tetrahydrodipicolinate reductase